MTQLPAYQSELKAWVDDALNLRLGFDSMDVRWGLRGPELTFHQVTVAAEGQEDPFLVARRAAVIVDPWTAVTQRELRVGRLTFEGTQLTLVRDPDGGMRLQGAPLGAEDRADLALVLPPEVEIGVRDSRVLYLDREQDVRWEFQDVTVSLSRSLDAMQLEARAEPPPELGSRIEVAAQSDLGHADRADRNWRVFGDLRDVNIEVLTTALPAAVTPLPQRGSGDLSIWLEWGSDSLDRGMIEANLDYVAWMAEHGVDAD